MLNRLLYPKRVSINTTRLALLALIWLIVVGSIPGPVALASLSQDQRTLSSRTGELDHGSVLDKYAGFAESPDPASFGVPTQSLPDLAPIGPHRVIPMPAVLDQLLLYPGRSVGGSKGKIAPASQETYGLSDESATDPEASDFFERQRRVDHEEVRQSLLKVAEEFGEEAQYVPYVWGGNQIGDTKACQACRSCIAKKSRLKVERRKSVCKPCQQCGIDCSHFVHRVFQDAGLEFPYTNTASLQRMSPMALLENLRLVDLGKDLRQVRPGDLLLKKKHIVVVLKTGDDGRGDVLHVSRSTRKMGPGGGIEIARDVDLTHFAGKLVKILRHRDTMMPAQPSSPQDNRDLREGDRPQRPGQGEPRDQESPQSHPLLWGPGEFIAQAPSLQIRL